MDENLSQDIPSINVVSEIKEDDVQGALEAFIASDRVSNARRLLSVIRNGQIKILNKEIVNHVIKTAIGDKVRPRIREICFMILETIVLNSRFKDEKHHLHSLVESTEHMLNQGPEVGYDQYVIDTLVSAINDPKVNLQTKSKILSFFSTLAAENVEYLNEDAVQSLSTFILNWLNGSTSSKVFSKISYFEPDGTPSCCLYTVLNQSQIASIEHALHHQVFSMLRLWFVNAHGLSIDEKDNFKPENKLRVPLPAGWTSKLFEYSTRLIEITLKETGKIQDIEFQNACLLEVICFITMVCYFDKSNIPVAHQMVRKVFEKLIVKESQVMAYEKIPVMLECLQFFIYFGKVVEYDYEPSLESFFRWINFKIINNQIASGCILKFALKNADDLSNDTKILVKFFPQFLKIVAWHPQSLFEYNEKLIPKFITSNTALEVFHTLIDLPCITASLTLNDYMQNVSSLEFPKEIIQINSSLKDFQPMINFILRVNSGVGDTFNKIAEFHSFFKPISKYPRIVSSASIANDLLQVFFHVLLTNLNSDVCSRLIPALLERSVLIYPVEALKNRSQKLMEKALLKICQFDPKIVFTFKSEFLEYISQVRHIILAPGIFKNAVWLIGEYISAQYIKSRSAEIITNCYEVLECATYEIVASYKHLKECCEAICYLAFAMTKLASRCQDLVPRALLCISKILKDTSINEDCSQDYNNIVCNRLNELTVMLKMPNLIASLLNPPKDIAEGKWHLNNCSSTAVIKTVDKLLTF